MPCHHSHCPTTAKSRCCYSSNCSHKLNNRLRRRHETLDRLETELATAEYAIASLARRLECRYDCTNMKAARRHYDDLTTTYECVRYNSSSRSHCYCRECAIGNKDIEISLLRRRVGIAENFEDFLRGLDGKRCRCCEDVVLRYVNIRGCRRVVCPSCFFLIDLS
jgi:hypothetical protein